MSEPDVRLATAVFPSAGAAAGETPLPREPVLPSGEVRAEGSSTLDAPSLITPNPAMGVRLIPRYAVDAQPPDDPQALRPLFESILRWGILQPVVVRPKGSRFELLAGRRRFAAAVAAGLEQVPCIVCDLTDDEARQLADDLNPPRGRPERGQGPLSVGTLPSSSMLQEVRAGMTALSTSLRLMENGPGLRRDVARRLVEMEIQRASWTLDAMVLAGRGPDLPTGGPVAIAPILRATAAAFEPECRLAGIRIAVSVDPADLSVNGSGDEIAAAISVMVGTVLAMMQESGGPDARVGLTARRENTDGTVVSVVQNVLPPDMCVAPRKSRLEGSAASARVRLGLLAVRKAVESWGGRLELRPDGPGAAFDLRLPGARVPE